jgi:hypothetical protein
MVGMMKECNYFLDWKLKNESDKIIKKRRLN